MQSLFCGTDSTEEVDAHALITTLYSDQRKTKVKKKKEQKTNKNMRFWSMN